MTVPSALIAFLFFLAGTAEVQVIHLPAKGKVALSLGAKGKAEVERTGTLSRISVELQGLQPASAALAGMNAYVVWAISPEGDFDNLGELQVDGDKGTLEATTRYDRLALLITSEPHYMVTKPNFTTMYKNEAARSARSVPLTIPTGQYEYPALPPRVLGVPPLVMQARAAVTIAVAAGAERLAEAELRQARVSLDTMEELLRRAAPEDVISASAHETIRRGERAFLFTLQNTRQ